MVEKPCGKSRRTTGRKRKCWRAGKNEKSRRMDLWDDEQIEKGVGDHMLGHQQLYPCNRNVENSAVNTWWRE